MEPTAKQFSEFQAIFDHFNHELFGDSLPQVMLTLTGRKKINGHFGANRWADSEDTVSEIALSPDNLARESIAVASTVVHEMVHLWQHTFGKPSRTGYHNAEWSAKMEAVGLMPSETGKPGGRRVGQRVTHYVLKEGPFARAFETLQHSLPYKSGSGGTAIIAPLQPAAKPDRNKVKYTCLCGINLWGKPALRVTCLECGSQFEPLIARV